MSSGASHQKKIKLIRLYRSRERTGLDNTRVNQTIEALQGCVCLSRLMCTVKASCPSFPCFILKDIVLACMYDLDIFFGFLSCLFLWNLTFHLLSSFVLCLWWKPFFWALLRCVYKFILFVVKSTSIQTKEKKCIIHKSYLSISNHIYSFN